MGLLMGFHGEEWLTSLVWHNVSSWTNMNNYSGMMIVDHPHIGYIHQFEKFCMVGWTLDWINMD